VHDKGLLGDMNFAAWSGAPVDLFTSVNPIYTELRRGLVKYRQRWGDLPQVPVPAGPTLKTGMSGDRVATLRTRLGLPDGDKFDAALASAVKEFQSVHGLKDDGIAGAGTIEALNRGAQYYEQIIIINMERAKRLPAPEEQRKYVLVDSGDARLSMWENGKKVDEMKIVVGKAETATPMMAAYIKYASVNPYWNVPPELVRSLIAPRVVAQGVKYLTDREYQVLTDYSDNAELIDPNTVDWRAVVDGRQEVRLRRLPSPANSMGMMKFMLPNYFGIYLHDSPEKEHFTKNELWISNGCVRVEDYKRLAKWLFDGSIPKGNNPKVEQEVDLPKPIPVYMTYLTAQPTANGIEFMPDHYGRDEHLMERFGTQLLAAVRGM
jgi:murein L,D-transpeptidase YcbB/YkuD